MIKIAILISGRGSNMVSLINAVERKNLDCQVACVIANKKSAGLTLAKENNIPTKLINQFDYESKFDHELALILELERHNPDWILLAGYMAILSSNFVEKFAGKIINIHPSLLPKFKGLNTHSRALKAGNKKHGTTVHVVTNELDDGPIIAQSEIRILANDTVETLEHRILQEEHILYPLILESLVKKYLEIKLNKVTWRSVPPLLDGEIINRNISIKPYLLIKNHN